MAEYRLIQETRRDNIDILEADSLEELVEKAAEMEGMA
jgi:hypothetical protein